MGPHFHHRRPPLQRIGSMLRFLPFSLTLYLSLYLYRDRYRVSEIDIDDA